MFFKDTLRLIRKTFNRFFSLVMIVLIGTAFMMGLMSTSTIMRTSVDKYNDESNLQDIQLYSSYGFCSEDIKGLEEIENIDNIFPSKMVDCYMLKENGSTLVSRLEEVDRSVNKFELLFGRLPEKENEAVVLTNSLENKSYKIGDKLSFYLEDSDLSEKISVTEYEVVGLAKSSSYMSKVLSTSNLANRDLDVVVFIPNDNFIFEYYTTIYLTIEGSKDKLSYTKGYENYISEKIEDLEGYSLRQQDYIKEELLEKYTKEISDNEELLKEKKAEGEEELNKVKEELDEARIKIIYAETTIETNKLTLDATSAQLKEQEKLLNESEKEVNDAVSQIEEQTGQSFDTVYGEISAAYSSYIAIEAQINSGGVIGNESVQRQLDELRREKAENTNRINEIQNTDLPRVEGEIATISNELENNPGDSDLERTLNNLNSEKESLNSELTTLRARNATIESIEYILSESVQDELTVRLKAMLNEMDNQFREYGFSDTKDAYNKLTTLKNGIDQIEEGKAQIKSAKAQIESGYIQLEDFKTEIEKNKALYKDGLKKYTEGILTFNEEIEKAENEIKKAYQDLDSLPDAKWMILDRSMHYSSLMYDNTCKQMGAIGYSMPFLFYLVAALVCMTTMTRLIDEQRSQIGCFRALGFSKNQVISKYVEYALFASLIGSIIGIILGIFSFPVVIYETWRLMYYLPDRKIVIPIWVVIVCVLAFSLLMMIVTYFVVRRTLEEVPSALLRPKAPKSAKAIFLEKIKFIWNRISFTGKITARNLIRYKTRLFMTVIGVAGCTALLVVGFGVKDSIADVIKIQFGDIFSYNYSVNLNNDHEIDDLLTELKSNLDNEMVVPYMSYTTKAYSKDSEATLSAIVIDARDSASVFNFRLASDKKTPIKLTNNGIIITEKFAKNNNIKKGDTITIESKDGLKAQVKVSEISEMYFQHYMFISEDYYNAIFDQQVHYTVIAINAIDEDMLKTQIGAFESVSSLTNFNNMINQFEIMINALDLIIIVIILTAGSLAFVVLVNLTQVNVSERLREIATLKVLGFNNKEVDMYIFKEIFILTLMGGFLGMPLGNFFHHFIMNVINMDMVMFGMNIKALSFIYSFLITIIFTIIVLMFTKKDLRKIQMVESLKSVE